LVAEGRHDAKVWPYLVLQILALGVVIAFPQIALWLPGTMSK
jgi:TRAP-type C4-dicarboxylate transport system permease large subunit